MATDLTHHQSPQMVDLTGLPEPVVQQVKQLVEEARQQQASTTPLRSPNQDDPERWSAEWRALIASRPRRDLTFDDDRESIYAGCGE